MIPYIVVFLMGIVSGAVILAWLREPLPPPFANHEGCEASFAAMRSKLLAEIRAKETEIHSLLKGQS